MKICSLISSNFKCGANFVHYMLADNHLCWDIYSLKGNGQFLFDYKINSFGFSNKDFLLKPKKIIDDVCEALSGYDVVVADGVLSYYLAKKVYQKGAFKKLIALVHNDYTINNRTNWNFVPNFVFNFLYDHLLDDLNVVTTSYSAKTALISRGLSVHYIENGVKEPLSGMRPCERDVVNIWYIGRLVKVKQVDMLVRACSKLNFDYCLNIVGEGDEKDFLLDLCEEKGIEYKYFGYQEKPFYYLNPGDIFVLPSLVEGRSIALMEALLSNAYCIVSDINANKEFVDYGAVSFDVASELDLIHKLECAGLTSLEDRSFKTDISKARVDFSIDAMRNKYLDFFSS